MKLHSAAEGWGIALDQLRANKLRSGLPIMGVVIGAERRFREILGGGIVVGRPFTTTEPRAGAPVVILERTAAERVFGRLDPLHRFVRLGGKPVEVVGLWQKPENIFEPPGQDIGAIVPFETARRSYRYDETNALIILVKPGPR